MSAKPRPSACPELDCVRHLLPRRIIAATERRARSIGVGAERVLICADTITEEAYLTALAHSLGTSYERFDGRRARRLPAHRRPADRCGRGGLAAAAPSGRRARSGLDRRAARSHRAPACRPGRRGDAMAAFIPPDIVRPAPAVCCAAWPTRPWPTRRRWTSPQPAAALECAAGTWPAGHRGHCACHARVWVFRRRAPGDDRNCERLTVRTLPRRGNPAVAECRSAERGHDQPAPDRRRWIADLHHHLRTLSRGGRGRRSGRGAVRAGLSPVLWRKRHKKRIPRAPKFGA
jgi:hypothetical protein